MVIKPLKKFALRRHRVWPVSGVSPHHLEGVSIRRSRSNVLGLAGVGHPPAVAEVHARRIRTGGRRHETYSGVIRVRWRRLPVDWTAEFPDAKLKPPLDAVNDLLPLDIGKLYKKLEVYEGDATRRNAVVAANEWKLKTPRKGAGYSEGAGWF